MKTFITVVSSENGLSVQYNDLPSHQIPASRIKELATKADSDLWRNQPARATELGRALFSVLDGTGGRLRAGMEKARDAGEASDLFLDLPPVADVLPFELMFHDGFLVLDHDVNIFRLVDRRGLHKRIDLEKRPLRVLFMACAPETQVTLDFEKEEELILTETEKLHLDLEVEDSGSLEGLKDKVVGAGGFDVVHLSGHADLDEKEGPVFYMETEVGGEDKVTPVRLQNALKGFRPRILFLSGCSTGKRASEHEKQSFAEQLAASGIPFVMGWARPVTDIGATETAARLFRYLAMGKWIAEAVRMARAEIRDVFDTWALFRVYSDATPAGAVIPPGMGIRAETFRKTVYRFLENSEVKVLEHGFVGRRRQIQTGVRVLRGFDEKKGLLITGAAGVGKSCLAGKLIERFRDKKLLVIHGKLETGEFFQKLVELFDRHGIRAGLEAVTGDATPEERIKALFRDAFQALPAIIYLDDFEQNLERVSSGGGDGFAVSDAALPLVRGLLAALPWAGGKPA